MRLHRTRGRGRASLLAATALVLLAAMTTSVAAAPDGHAARRHSMTVRDTATMHKTRKSGSTIYESGTATGTLPGTVTAVFNTSNPTKFTGKVTFHSGRSSITMTVVGYPQSTKTVVPVNGSLAVRSGTGRFKNALGSGTFSGTVNRRTWAATVRAKANITY